MEEYNGYRYHFNSSSTQDPDGVVEHEEYPDAMEVYQIVYDEALGKYTAHHIAALDNFLTYKGTSIRFSTDPDAKNGIRVITGIPWAEREALINGTLLDGTALAGYKLVEYGTLIKRADAPGDLIYGGESVQSSYAFRASVGEDRQYAHTGIQIQYTGAFVGLTHDLCDDELLLRSYMILEKDGHQVVIYGGILQRNIGYVAYQNKDYKPNTSVAEFIWGIIRAVYGDKVQG